MKPLDKTDEVLASKGQYSKQILAILAHPDDESYGMGGTLAKYSHNGAHVTLLCATRGEAGIAGMEPGEAGQIREKEFEHAVEYLGAQVFFLGYQDGELSTINRQHLVDHIAGWIDTVNPDVILTFGPDGVSGHPDHVAISAAVTQAVDQFFPYSNLLYLAQSEATVLGCGVSGNQDNSAESLIKVDIGEYKINKVHAFQSHKSQNTELLGKPEEEVQKIPCFENFSLARSVMGLVDFTNWFNEYPRRIEVAVTIQGR